MRARCSVRWYHLAIPRQEGRIIYAAASSSGGQPRQRVPNLGQFIALEFEV